MARLLLGCLKALGMGTEAVGEGTAGETILEGGLVTGHAYSLLATTTYEGNQLYQIRNPHAGGEWTGAWSDDSAEMTALAKAALGNHGGDDGTLDEHRTLAASEARLTSIEATARRASGRRLTSIEASPWRASGRRLWACRINWRVRRTASFVTAQLFTTIRSSRWPSAAAIASLSAMLRRQPSEMVSVIRSGPSRSSRRAGAASMCRTSRRGGTC